MPEAAPPAKRIFTLTEASALLPTVQRVTADAFRRVDDLTSRLRQSHGEQDRRRLEREVADAFQEWVRVLQALDVEVKGPWLVDFDNGQGYYCWQYPEPAITHFHGYTDGFRGRMKIV